MVHEFMVSVALMKLAAAFVGGCCGLLMCRAMLRSPTASSVRREAALSMLKPGNCYFLNSHQRAAVFRDLSASGIPLEKLTLPAPFPGGIQALKPSSE